jgi:hypothetical protein
VLEYFALVTYVEMARQRVEMHKLSRTRETDQRRLPEPAPFYRRQLLPATKILIIGPALLCSLRIAASVRRLSAFAKQYRAYVEREQRHLVHKGVSVGDAS